MDETAPVCPRLSQTPDGRRLEISREIDADPSTVWDVFIDTREWPAWGPSVTDVDCPDRRIQAGSTGRVRLPGGLWVPFSVASFSSLPDDPTRDAPARWTWRVARIPATGHRVERQDGTTKAVFELPVAAAGYAPVCHRALSRIEEITQ